MPPTRRLLTVPELRHARFGARRRRDPRQATSRENLFSLRTLLAPSPSDEFLAQRVSLLYRLCGSDVPTIILTSAVAAFALWGYVGDNLLVSWLIWLGTASLLRFLLNRAYRIRQPGPEGAARWEGFFCIASALVGSAWGLTVMLLYPERTQVPDILGPFIL